MQSGYVPVDDGLEMYYEAHGEDTEADAVPLVLIPGGLHTIGLSFGAVLPRLAARRRVIGFELQGHGHTADVERPLSIRRLATDVVEALRQIEVERADFFGFSLGGLVSLDVAVSRPDLVRRLALAATHYRPDAYFPEITDPAMTSPRLPTAEEFEAMQAAFAAVAPDPAAFETVAMRYQPVVHTEFVGWMDAEMRALTHPVLLMVGDFDFIPLDHAVAMRDLIPNSSLAVLPGTRHTEVVEHPATVGFVETFLDAST